MKIVLLLMQLCENVRPNPIQSARIRWKIDPCSHSLEMTYNLVIRVHKDMQHFIFQAYLCDVAGASVHSALLAKLKLGSLCRFR